VTPLPSPRRKLGPSALIWRPIARPRVSASTPTSATRSASLQPVVTAKAGTHLRDHYDERRSDSSLSMQPAEPRLSAGRHHSIVTPAAFKTGWVGRRGSAPSSTEKLKTDTGVAPDQPSAIESRGNDEPGPPCRPASEHLSLQESSTCNARRVRVGAPHGSIQKHPHLPPSRGQASQASSSKGGREKMAPMTSIRLQPRHANQALHQPRPHTNPPFPAPCRPAAVTPVTSVTLVTFGKSCHYASHQTDVLDSHE